MLVKKCIVLLLVIKSHYTEAQSLNSTLRLDQQEYIERLIQQNAKLPRPCRTDLCTRGSITEERKGSYTWPDIQVGSTIKFVCKHELNGISIEVEGQCTIDEYGKAVFLEPDIATICPDPPLAQLLETIAHEYQTVPLTLNYKEELITRLFDAFSANINDTIWETDLENLLVYSLDIIPDYLNSSKQISKHHAKKWLGIIDMVISTPKMRYLLEFMLPVGGYQKEILDQIYLLSSIIEIEYKIDSINLENIEIFLVKIFPDQEFQLDLSSPSFERHEKLAYQMRLNFNQLITEELQAGVVFIKEMSYLVTLDTFTTLHKIAGNVLLVEDYDTYEDTETEDYQDNGAYKDYSEAESDAILGGTLIYEDNGDVSEEEADIQRAGSHLNGTNSDVSNEETNIRPAGSHIIGSNSNVFESDTDTQVKESHINIDYIETAPDNTQQESQSDQVSGDRANTEHTTGIVLTYVPNGPLLMATITGMQSKLPYKEVRFEYEVECVASEQCEETAPPICVEQKLADTQWEIGSCRLSKTAERENLCSCSGNGFYGSAVEVLWNGIDSIGRSLKTTLVPVQLDVSSFLGFPYSKELSLLGTVLNAVSFLCIVATLLSFALAREARRGRSTLILLNLCIALMALSGTLFITEGVVYDEFGCTAANVARYYLVFVTLLWNTIEAVNMYILLVYVMPRNNISRFILKSCVSAWGLPLIMVAVALAVDQKAFDGKYIVVSQIDELNGECAFRCSLKDEMLYFGYLLPMGVIIFNNSITFLFVLRVILGKTKLSAQKRRGRLVQLLGVAATLVLLGIPWIFSAFGTLDVGNNKTLGYLEGIFQVVFVVFINLQGLFIFTFHCVRNHEIRSSWSSMANSLSGNQTTKQGSAQSETIKSNMKPNSESRF